jgi:multiple sugar transport system substrate-binding protein
MKQHMTRRGFLKLTGTLGAGAAFGASQLAPFGRVFAQDAVTLQFWDHFQPLQPLLESVFASYSAANPGVTVQHTVYSPPDLGQALQLAFPAQQAPDMFAVADVGLPLAALHAEGWFSPLGDYADPDWMAALPPSVLVEGRTLFDGKLYSFPVFSFRFHEVLTWYNKQLLADAGYDPEVGVRTWDEFRDAAAKITQSGSGMTFGWIQGIGHIGRMSDSLNSLAKLAGATDTFDYATGEFLYGSDAYVNALEFLVSMAMDGSLSPSSITNDTRNARARWAAGEGGLFMDGPWNIGVLVGSAPDFVDQVGVCQAPTPEGGSAYMTRGGKSGDFWISGQTANPQHAANIMQQFTAPEFQIGLAERMDQPPLDPTAVANANVHPTYAQSIAFFEEMVRLAPDPLVKNPAVAEVQARMSDIRPNLGEIVQGAVAGEIGDIRAALQTYNDQVTAERDRAIEAARAEGFEVSVDDWVFSNWVAGEDYGGDKYGSES